MLCYVLRFFFFFFSSVQKQPFALWCGDVYITVGLFYYLFDYNKLPFFILL